MSWPQTLAICSSIFLAVGLNDPKVSFSIGVLFLICFLASLVSARMKFDQVRNREEKKHIKQERNA